MQKDLPSVLFSTQTELSLFINKKFYDDKHYMYCSPYIGYPHGRSNPPSSTPIAKYTGLFKESKKNDINGVYISTHKTGLLRGAESKFNSGVIDIEIQRKIIELINQAQATNYSPVLCQININLDDEAYIEKYTYNSDPLSEEYLIQELPGKFIICQQLEDE